MSVHERLLLTTSDFKLERRSSVSRLGSLALTITSVLLALAASSVLLLIEGVNIKDAFLALVLGAFGDLDGISGTFVKAAPLVFGGLSAAVAFKARIWNVGQEGQFYAGAMMAFWVASSMELPKTLLLPLILIAAILGGGMMGLFAGHLKAKFNVDEIVSTVMGNYLIVLLLSYLLASKLWMAPGQYYMQTPIVPPNSQLPILLTGSSIHAGVILAVIAAVLMQFLLTRTTFGYDVRALGLNPVAARFRGINSAQMTILVLALSGALAGIGGAIQTFGVDYRLTTSSLQSLGATGIIVGVVAGMHPLGVAVAALLFGALAQGALVMEVMVDVSSAVVSAMQAIILIFFVSISALSRYRIVRSRRDV
jgi:simple sugar transport system permease protein